MTRIVSGAERLGKATMRIDRTALGHAGLLALFSLPVILLLTACGEAGGSGPGWSEPRGGDAAGTPPGFLAIEPDLVIDAEGVPALAWHEQFRVRFSRFDYALMDWGEATSPNSFDDYARNPRLAFDASNDAIAVWEGNEANPDANGPDVIGAHYDAADAAMQGWDLDVYVSDTSLLGGTYNPELAVDPAGDAVVVYRETLPDGGVTGGYRSDVYANTYDADTGTWGADPVVISSEVGTERVGYGPDLPRIAMDASGDAIAVWDEIRSGRDTIVAARYESGSWGAAVPIDDDDGGTSGQYWIDMEPGGTAIVVFTQDLPGTVREGTYGPRFSNGSWAAPELLETADSQFNYAPRVEIDASGNALAIWLQGSSSPTFTSDPWASYFDATTGTWSEGEQIAFLPGRSTGGQGGTGHPGSDLAFDADGNAIVVWTQLKDDRDEKDIWSIRRDAASGSWSLPAPVEPFDVPDDLVGTTTRDATHPEIEFDADGHAIAVWQQWNGDLAQPATELWFSWWEE